MKSKAWSWRHAIIKSELPATTRHVLLTLSCYMNELGEGCYPTTKTLASATGLSERAICTHLDKAHTTGWLGRKRHGFAGQKWANHEYEPSFPEEKGTERGSVRTCEGAEPNDTKALNEVQSNSPSTSPIEKPTKQISVQSWFDQFWKAYPRRKSKDGAKRKFQSLLKRGTDPKMIVVGARRYARLCASLGTELQFMKHPTTWLNNGCWEDEDLPAAPDDSAPHHHSPDKWRRMVDLVISGGYPWEESSMGPPPGHPDCVCPKNLITPQLIERCKPEGAFI